MGAPRIEVRGIGAVGLCVALIFLALLGARPGAATLETFKLAGQVSGGSGKNAVYVAQADGFLTKPVREIRLSEGLSRCFSLTW